MATAVKSKRVSAYNQALKQYNEGRDVFSFVKKGTADYDAVKAIESKIKESNNKALEAAVAAAEAPPVDSPPKKTRGRPKKAASTA